MSFTAEYYKLVTVDKWHVTQDSWHMTHDRFGCDVAFNVWIFLALALLSFMQHFPWVTNAYIYIHKMCCVPLVTKTVSCVHNFINNVLDWNRESRIYCEEKVRLWQRKEQIELHKTHAKHSKTITLWTSPDDSISTNTNH